MYCIFSVRDDLDSFAPPKMNQKGDISPDLVSFLGCYTIEIPATLVEVKEGFVDKKNFNIRSDKFSSYNGVLNLFKPLLVVACEKNDGKDGGFKSSCEIWDELKMFVQLSQQDVCFVKPAGSSEAHAKRKSAVEMGFYLLRDYLTDFIKDEYDPILGSWISIFLLKVKIESPMILDGISETSTVWTIVLIVSTFMNDVSFEEQDLRIALVYLGGFSVYSRDGTVEVFAPVQRNAIDVLVGCSAGLDADHQLFDRVPQGVSGMLLTDLFDMLKGSSLGDSDHTVVVNVGNQGGWALRWLLTELNFTGTLGDVAQLMNVNGCVGQINCNNYHCALVAANAIVLMADNFIDKSLELRDIMETQILSITTALNGSKMCDNSILDVLYCASIREMMNTKMGGVVRLRKVWQCCVYRCYDIVGIRFEELLTRIDEMPGRGEHVVQMMQSFLLVCMTTLKKSCTVNGGQGCRTDCLSRVATATEKSDNRMDLGLELIHNFAGRNQKETTWLWVVIHNVWALCNGGDLSHLYGKLIAVEGTTKRNNGAYQKDRSLLLIVDAKLLGVVLMTGVAITVYMLSMACMLMFMGPSVMLLSKLMASCKWMQSSCGVIRFPVLQTCNLIIDCNRF